MSSCPLADHRHIWWDTTVCHRVVAGDRQECIIRRSHIITRLLRHIWCRQDTIHMLHHPNSCKCWIFYSYFKYFNFNINLLGCINAEKSHESHVNLSCIVRWHFNEVFIKFCFLLIIVQDFAFWCRRIKNPQKVKFLKLYSVTVQLVESRAYR